MSKVEIDDSDSSIIWTGPWTRTGIPSEHDNTVSGSRNAGNTALVSFIGTSITVYGTIPKMVSNISSISEYSLDGGPLEGTFAPLPSNDTQFQQTFFACQELPNGLHRLHILDTISSDGLWLDFFVITTALETSTFSVSPSLLSSSALPTQSADPSQATQGAQTSSKSHSNSWIIAVSLAIGGCAIIVATIVTVCSLRRLRQSQREVRAARSPEGFVVEVQQPLQPAAVSGGHDPGVLGARRELRLGVTLPSSPAPGSDITSSGTDIWAQRTDIAMQPPGYSEGQL